MKKISLIVLMCLLLQCLSGCTAGISSKNSMSPEQVLKEHFKLLNEKKVNKLEQTVTKRHEGTLWGTENLEYIKIISIEEDTTEATKSGYLDYGAGAKKKPTDLKIFKVKYEVKYKDDQKGPQPSGEYEWNYFLIKENKDSPWLIDDWGY